MVKHEKEEYHDVYDKHYFDFSCGAPYIRNEHWLNFFGEIAKKIKNEINPKTVLDVGCAKGFLVEQLRANGIEASGIDISEYAINEVIDSIKPYCKVDSILKLPKASYDLAICIEVVEHLLPKDAKLAIYNLCQQSNDIIFSSSPVDVEEKTHHNVQNPSYWANLFAENNFYRDEKFDASFITPWAIRFKKRSMSDKDLIFSYEEAIWSINQERDNLKKKLDQFENDLTYYKKEHENVVEDKKRLISETQLEAKNYYEKQLEKTHLDFNERLEKAHLDFNERLEKTKVELETNHKARLYEENLKILELQERLTKYYLELREIRSSPIWKMVPTFRKNLNRYFPGGTRRRFFVDSVVRKIILKNYANQNLISDKKTDDKIENNQRPSDDEIYNTWIKLNEPNTSELENQKIESKKFSQRPLISIIVPVFETPENLLREVIASIVDQTYDYWEVCLVDGGSKEKSVKKTLQEYSEKDTRIKVKLLPNNLGISGNSNEAIKLASGEFIALLDHDDTISPNALFEVVKCINDNPNADFIYSDKDAMSNDGKKRYSPLFKPEWSPEIMLSANYLTHFNVMRKSLVDKIGGFRSETDGAQDWDIFLRITDITSNIFHIPKILYHWRDVITSVSSGIQAKPYALKGQMKTIENHLKRCGSEGAVTMNQHLYPQIKWNVKKMKFSIILPVINGEKFQDTLESIIKNTKYQDYEIILVRNSLVNSITIKHPPLANIRTEVLDCKAEHFEMCKNTLKFTKGDFIVFIKEGLLVESPNWLEEFNGLFSLKNIGIVTGKILDLDSKIVHVGLTVSPQGNSCYIYQGAPERFWGRLGSAEWYRDCMAASDEILAYRKDVIPIENMTSFTSVEEMCASVYNKNNRIVYSPNVILRSSEIPQVIRKISNFDSKNFEQIRVKGDPYFNSNLSYDNPIPTLNIKTTKNESSSIQPTTDVKVASQKQVQSNIETNPMFEKRHTEALYLSTRFDFNSQELRLSKELQKINNGNITIKRVAWFLPNFENAFFGGINTILRFASFLKNKGISNYFVIVDVANEDKIRQSIKLAFPDLKDEKIIILNTNNDLKKVPEVDVSICTLWTTAYYSLKFNKTKQKFYFIQDFEPFFYEAGSTMALVEATYRFGFFGIANTSSLKKIYHDEYGGVAESFDPAVDTMVFYPPKNIEKLDEKEITIFVYGRPGHPRNGFELAITILKKIKEKYGNKVKIISAGADWNPSDFGLEGIIENMGILPYEKTGEIFRKCHIGLIMMFTKHPSYIPLELMACTCLVISNYNPATTWLLKDGENCLLCQPSTSSFVERISDAIDNKDLRARIIENAMNFTNKYSNWNSEFEKIYSFIQNPLRRE